MTTKAPPHIADILAELRQILVRAAREGIELQVSDDGFVEEGDWLNIIVTPIDPNMRAYDYVKKLNQMENELRGRVGRKKILLVPAIPA